MLSFLGEELFGIAVEVVQPHGHEQLAPGSNRREAPGVHDDEAAAMQLASRSAHSAA